MFCVCVCVCTYKEKKKKTTFTGKFNLRKKLLLCYIWSIALNGTGNWKLRQVDQECQWSFKIWCWRKMEKTIWIDGVRNEVLHTVREYRNFLHAIKRREADWVGHVLRRNCLTKHVIWGKIEERLEGRGRRGRRHNQPPDDLTGKRGRCKFREEALVRTLWGTRFGTGTGLVVRQTTECMNAWVNEYMRSAKKCTGSGVGTVTSIRARRPGFLSQEAKRPEFQADDTHTHTHTPPSIKIEKGRGSASTSCIYFGNKRWRLAAAGSFSLLYGYTWDD